MAFGRRAAGFVVAGWLIAGAIGAGCAESSAEVDPTAEADAPSPTLLAGTPTATPTISPTVFPPLDLDPNINNPSAACEALKAGSTFKGYLIETAADATCPLIGTSIAQWEGATWRPVDNEEMVEPRNAYFVGATQASFCVYTIKALAVIVPMPSATDRYNALKASLGYPNHVSRDIFGILCQPPAAAAAAPDSAVAQGGAEASATIPICRKCASVTASAVDL